MGRSTSEQGAERSVQIRRQQGPERQRLIREIEAEQKKISSLNEERAPIAAEVRKVEAEVGPIKYIAALIYGDNPEANLLERAVRWVIILLVLVFDPLALVLVLASNTSRKWEFSEKTEQLIAPNIIEPEKKDDVPTLEVVNDPDENLKEEPNQTTNKDEKPVEQTYLTKPWVDKVFGIRFPHQVYKPEVKPQIEPEIINCIKCNKPLEKIPGIGLFCTNIECDKQEIEILDEVIPQIQESPKVEIKTEGITKPIPFKTVDGGYIVYDNKTMKKEAFVELHPEFLKLTADSNMQINTSFGKEFPKMANKGDVFIRVDVSPNRVFKFDGIKWIEINKQNSDSYLYDKQYLNYLIDKIDRGEYDIELLSDNEKMQIEKHLKNQNT